MTDLLPFLNAALTPVTVVTAVVACWVAIRQYQAKKLDLKLARYDKRFKVYQALKDFIAGVIDEPSITAITVRQFDIATNEASFLFEDEVCNYLKLLRKRAEEMGSLTSQIERLLADRERNEDRTHLVRQKSELAEWFFNQFDDSKTKFEKYLSIKDESSGRCHYCRKRQH